MRALFLATLIVTSLLSAAEKSEPDVASRFGDTLKDPRQPVNFHLMFDAGDEPKGIRNISNSILIICWVPTPDGASDKYQISGLDGYHTKEQVEKFLHRFYEADHFKETQMQTPNIVLAGNNWGAGLELKETLKMLSAKKAIAVYYVGGWAFSKVSLIPEPEARKQLIARSYQQIGK